MSRKSDLIAVLSMAILLALTAVSLLIWMSVLRWEDHTGAVVGVIFIMLTVLQSGLSVYWYKVGAYSRDCVE